MTLKIEDIKPGDILCYNDDWYILVIQTPSLERTLDYVWISGNSDEKLWEKEAFRLASRLLRTTLKFPDMLNSCRKITHLNNKILIEELKKIDNRT